MKKFFYLFFFFSLATSLLAKNKSLFIPHVDVYKVPATHNIPVVLKYPARIKEYSKVIIVARVEGILEKKFFKEGDFVKKGTLLYTIEPDIFLANVQSAKANLNRAIASFKDAEKNWLRIKALFKDNVTSKEKKDNAFYLYESSKAEVNLARANLKKATINLNYTKIFSPIDGFASLKYIDTGNLVHNGTKLLQITKTNPIYAEFSVPDKDFLKYALFSYVKKRKLIANIEKGNIIKTNGYVDFADVNIDKYTSTVKLRAVFQNKDKKLYPGEFVRIILKGIQIKDKIEIPQQALIQNEKGTFVFIVKKGKVLIKPVITAGTHGNNFIVEKGLNEGDLVILNNFFRIRPKSQVIIDKIIE